MNNDFNDIFDKEQLKQNPFKVPAGYFDSLNTRIMENVARQASAQLAPFWVVKVFHILPYSELFLYFFIKVIVI